MDIGRDVAMLRFQTTYKRTACSRVLLTPELPPWIDSTLGVCGNFRLGIACEQGDNKSSILIVSKYILAFVRM